MNTRSEDALPYRELARQGAAISRSFPVARIPRLAALAVPVTGEERDRQADDLLSLQLAFSLTEEGPPRMVGRLTGSIRLDCNGCAETRRHRLEIAIDCLIAASEADADELTPLGDVVVAAGPELDLIELVEDEILLNLPERLCTQTPCEHTPVLAYPAPGQEAGTVAATDAGGATDESNPFAVLADLKKR